MGGFTSLVTEFRFMSWMVPLCCLAAAGGTARAADVPTSRVRPNIFIIADDLGYTDIGANNPATFYETPHIDGLATRAMRFTDAYAACPVCSPTRASIMVGQYPARCGITDYINASGGNQPEHWKRKTRLLPAPYQD